MLPGERECAFFPRCASVRAPGGLVPTGGAGSRGSKSLGTPLEAPPKIYLAKEFSRVERNVFSVSVCEKGGIEMRNCGGVQVAHVYRVTIPHRHRGGMVDSTPSSFSCTLVEKTF